MLTILMPIDFSVVTEKVTLSETNVALARLKTGGNIGALILVPI